MRSIQCIFKECDIEKSLRLLLAGVQKKHFDKRLTQYYSLYCAVIESWTEEDNAVDWILTDFMQLGWDLNAGVEVYGFLGKKLKTLKLENLEVAELLDWDQLLLGKARIFVPECIDKIDTDEVFCALFLRQIAESSTITVRKIKNRKLFDKIKLTPGKKGKKIEAYEASLEMYVQYQMNRKCIRNDILVYQERLGKCFKWRELIEAAESKIPFSDSPVSLWFDSSFEEDFPVNDDILSGYEYYFLQLDEENPPDILRLHHALREIQSELRSMTYLFYQVYVNSGKRIIIEHNPECEKLPHIYIRDGEGNVQELDHVGSIFGIQLSELLCMEIFVLDHKITEPCEVMMLLVFYIEYPIRVKRLQSKCFE